MSKPTLVVAAHSPGPSGLGRYAREMTQALAQTGAFGRIVLAGEPATLAGWGVDATLLPFVHPRYGWRIPGDWARIEAAVRGPRVSWFPHWDAAWSAAPGVVTIHDLILLDQPGLRGLAQRLVARAWIGRVVRGSAALVTGSEHTAAQVADAFPAARGKLTAIHHGVAPAFAAVRRAPVTRPYLLTVGNKRPHKRFDTAIRAFALLAQERPDLDLVMVGHRGSHTASLHALAASLGVAARVQDREALSDAELAQCYANAEALLVTSQDEGFGLIALEAMAAGCPVIAVDRGPFREVIGAAGLLVPYDNPAAIATALRQLDAPAREAVIAEGRRRAQAYTWTRAAERLAEVLTAASA